MTQKCKFGPAGPVTKIFPYIIVDALYLRILTFTVNVQNSFFFLSLDFSQTNCQPLQKRTKD